MEENKIERICAQVNASGLAREIAYNGHSERVREKYEHAVNCASCREVLLYEFSIINTAGYDFQVGA